MMPVRTLILDLDGPILESRHRQHACYAEILNASGFPTLSVDDYWERKKAGASAGDLLALTGAESLREPFKQRWMERIEEPDLLELDTVQPGSAAKLHEWKTDNYRLLLVTLRKEPSHLRDQLRALDVDRFFDRVIVCEHRYGGEGKCRRLQEETQGLDPSECIWIGDTEVDIQAARSFGCPVWAVTCGVRSEAMLRSFTPDEIRPDLHSIHLGGSS